MASGIAASDHIKIRGEVGVHVAAVCLVIGEDITGFESGGTTGVYDGFRKEPKPMVPQKQFMGIILNGKISNK